MAAGKGKNRKAATENSVSSSTCPTEESPRRWHTNKGESQRFPVDTADYLLPINDHANHVCKSSHQTPESSVSGKLLKRKKYLHFRKFSCAKIQVKFYLLSLVIKCPGIMEQ